MPVTVESFRQALVASGLISAGDLHAIYEAFAPNQLPESGEQFAAQLVGDGKLTRFQADVLIAGVNIPLVLGEYVVLEKIGAGGMGQVFKAFHRRMKRVAAIKLMSGILSADPGAIRRFHREVEAAAKLDHPNIVATYDAGEVAGHQYLAMQFIEGADLSTFVRKNPPLSIEQAVDFICQAAQGLAYAHGEGIVHRDIKPGNLLVDQRGVVKVLDMGLVRIEGVASSAELTGTRQMLGTIDYMSPEQATETAHVDQRTDIYSLGCTLWYLLTGKRMYDGDTAVRRLMQHREAPLPSLVRARDDATWPLEQVFHKMVAKRADDRYASMAEVSAALTPFRETNASYGGTAVPSISDPLLASFLSNIGAATRTSATRTSATIASTPAKSLPQPSQEIEVDDDNTSSFSETPTDVKRALAATLLETSANGGLPAANRTTPRKSPYSRVAVGLGAIAVAGLAAFYAFRPHSTLDATSGDRSTPAAAVPVASATPAPRVVPKPADVPFDDYEARRRQRAWADYLGIEPQSSNSLQMRLALIPPGSFEMGATEAEIVAVHAGMVSPPPSFDRELDRAQQPKHRVTLTRPFLLATNETTVDQFAEFCAATKHKTAAESGAVVALGWMADTNYGVADPKFNWRNVGYEQTGKHPVGCVSWHDAIAFCNWLSAREGLPSAYQESSIGKPVMVASSGYRLPTEAEWEYACRAGTTTPRFWGDDTSGSHTSTYVVIVPSKQTQPVGERVANPFGLHDILGNAAEWVYDRYEVDYYGKVAAGVVDPVGPSFSSGADNRVFRGISVSFRASGEMTAAHRNRRSATTMLHNVGFRVARSLDVN